MSHFQTGKIALYCMIGSAIAYIIIGLCQGFVVIPISWDSLTVFIFILIFAAAIGGCIQSIKTPLYDTDETNDY